MIGDLTNLMLGRKVWLNNLSNMNKSQVDEVLGNGKISPWMLKKSSFLSPTFLPTTFFFCTYLFLQAWEFSLGIHSSYLSSSCLLLLFIFMCLFFWHVLIKIHVIVQTESISLGLTSYPLQARPVHPSFWFLKLCSPGPTPPPSPLRRMCVKFPGCLSVSSCQLLSHSQS